MQRGAAAERRWWLSEAEGRSDFVERRSVQCCNERAESSPSERKAASYGRRMSGRIARPPCHIPSLSLPPTSLAPPCTAFATSARVAGCCWLAALSLNRRRLSGTGVATTGGSSAAKQKNKSHPEARGGGRESVPLECVSRGMTAQLAILDALFKEMQPVRCRAQTTARRSRACGLSERRGGDAAAVAVAAISAPLLLLITMHLSAHLHLRCPLSPRLPSRSCRS